VKKGRPHKINLNCFVSSFTNFNINELESSLKSVKPETDASLDAVYLEFMNSETQTASSNGPRLPLIFQNPGKDGFDPVHYRPISQLSVMYKLLEQMIHQCIEAATPVHQAGFRKHRSYTEHGTHYTH
jgi:hypothetical protein